MCSQTLQVTCQSIAAAASFVIAYWHIDLTPRPTLLNLTTHVKPSQQSPSDPPHFLNLPTQVGSGLGSGFDPGTHLSVRLHAKVLQYKPSQQSPSDPPHSRNILTQVGSGLGLGTWHTRKKKKYAITYSKCS